MKRVDAAWAGPVLEVSDLTVQFRSGREWSTVVEGVSFVLERNEILGFAGESGSGKSVTSLAIMGLIRNQGGRVSRGAIRFNGRDLTEMSEMELCRIRGGEISMVFQQALRSLNPSKRVGAQIAEAVRLHQGGSRSEAWDRAVRLLDRVGIPDHSRRAVDYPHQFSGGMCQRVMIAMALACAPKVLIADEPTTALDVTVQRRILDLLVELQEESGVAVLLVSHDLGAIAEYCDRVAVMYAGQVVEQAEVDALFDRPRHPYTQALLDCVPRGSNHRLPTIAGTVPPPSEFTDICRFAPRCSFFEPRVCDSEPPVMTVSGEGHASRCLRAGRIVLPGVSVE